MRATYTGEKFYWWWWYSIRPLNDRHVNVMNKTCLCEVEATKVVTVSLKIRYYTQIQRAGEQNINPFKGEEKQDPMGL